MSLKTDATEYIAEKRIDEIFNLLIGGLLIEKPADPLQYMIERLEALRQLQQETNHTDATTIESLDEPRRASIFSLFPQYSLPLFGNEEDNDATTGQ